MSTTIESRLAELGIELPEAAAPVGNYVPFVISGDCVYISGQVPAWNGEIKYVGKLGAGLSSDDGYHAARTCAMNVLAQLRVACGGDLDKVSRVIKLGGFVNCAPDFNDAPRCVNGASDLMVEVFGEVIGPHARFAVGVSSLPAGVAVEVDGIFEIK
jgi:enamine deaminase RidA (YjgF/YER057c/UK114 family)